MIESHVVMPMYVALLLCQSDKNEDLFQNEGDNLVVGLLHLPDVESDESRRWEFYYVLYVCDLS